MPKLVFHFKNEAMKIHGVLLTVMMAAAMCCACQSADPFIVKTQSGLVKGIEQDGTMAFLGIPYAKVERFMPPKPVDKWDTVRLCDHFGPQAMQNTNGRTMTEAEMSEHHSCVLNIWTTDPKASKPVMLWIHGGGFDSGASTWNPGMGLAKKDVVLVSLNHRLNILGFLDLSSVSDKYKYSGNVGMLDIVAALGWIKDNIEQFGGDPHNVTIFGESGGGGKVGTLLCMPSAKGLFHKAIIMSGTILNVNTKAMTEALGQAVLKELNISEDHIEQLTEVPYTTLYQAGQKAMANSIGARRPGTPMMWGFGPTPDGETVVQQPFQPGIASFSLAIPLLIGTTFNELQPVAYQRLLTPEEARTELLPTFGDDTDAYIQAFTKAYPDATPQDWLSIDWMFRPKSLITADAVAANPGTTLYSYLFAWRSPRNNASMHGQELNFCFNTLDLAARDLPQPTPQDVQLAEIMSNVWAQFAHNGDPNTEDLPQWEPYSIENEALMVFDYECELRHNPDRELQNIINAHCFKQLEDFYKNH